VVYQNSSKGDYVGHKLGGIMWTVLWNMRTPKNKMQWMQKPERQTVLDNNDEH
jgi:hypothetical protein